MKLSRDRVRMNQSIKVISWVKRLTAMGIINTVGRVLTLPSMSISLSSIIYLHQHTLGHKQQQWNVVCTSGSLLRSGWSRSPPGCDPRSSVCRRRQQVHRGSESGCKCLERWEECAAGGTSVRVCPCVCVCPLFSWAYKYIYITANLNPTIFVSK